MQKRNKIDSSSMSKSAAMRIPRYLGLSKISRSGGLIDLDFGYSGRLTKSVQVDDVGLDGLMQFLQPATPNKAAKSLKKPKNDMKKATSSLEKAGLLMRHETPPARFKRYDRHLLFYHLAGAVPMTVQKSISQSTVALIGMGGIGNWVSLGLIGAGLKRLKLIDFDRIELSNLTRQVLFNESDVGKHKVEVAAERLAPKNRQTKIETILESVNDSKSLLRHLQGVDFVVLSADRPAEIHDWVDEVCVREKIPYINIGYRDGEGVVGPLTVPGVTSCYQCFKPAPSQLKSNDRAERQWERSVMEAFEERYQAPSFGPLNGLVSSIGVVEVLKYLGGFGVRDSLDTELRIDPLNLSIGKTKYKRDRKCWHCSKQKSAK